MAIEFYEAAATAPSGASAGVFVPISDLPGVNSGELANSEATNKKLAKAIYGLAIAISNNVSGALGLSVSRNTNSAGTDLTNNVFNLSNQFYADHETKEIDVLPVPTSGENTGEGILAVTEVFANAAKIAADDAIPGEGILIPTADLQRYGSPDHATLDPAQDSRLWFQGLGEFFGNEIPLRSGENASAIVGRSRGNTQPITLAPVATDSTNPTTGLTSSDLNKISVFAHTYSITVQVKLNQNTQTFEVNHVTS